MTGAADIKPKHFILTYTDMTGIARLLVQLTITWPDAAAGALDHIKFASKTIWNAGSSSSPTTINSTDWLLSPSDRLLAAFGSDTLEVHFANNIAGTGNFIVQARWDDAAGSGTNICDSAPVTVTP